jgi:SagB-type dehydrogenase family enzyme
MITRRQFLGVMLMSAASAHAQQVGPVKLPRPQLDGGLSLMQALQARRSSREFAQRRLSQQALSNLLWAAFGVNRPDSGGRTAPSAHNWQEIDVYVALEEGVYVYYAKGHTLVPVGATDLRAKTGQQEFVGTAPLDLVYVANYGRMGPGNEQEKQFLAACDTGFIAQNVYLACASEGLASVVRGWVDRAELRKALGLKRDQHIVLAQTVGYPAG